MMAKSLIFLYNSYIRETKLYMSINTFQLWNRSFGWGVFTVALLTYGLTVEPTASFWDAGEYIATVPFLDLDLVNEKITRISIPRK